MSNYAPPQFDSHPLATTIITALEASFSSCKQNRCDTFGAVSGVDRSGRSVGSLHPGVSFDTSPVERHAARWLHPAVAAASEYRLRAFELSQSASAIHDDTPSTLSFVT